MGELERVSAVERAGRETVDALQAAVLAFDSQRARLAEQGDLESLAVGLVRLRELQKSFRILLDAVEQDVARLMEKPVVELDGIGVLQRRRGSARVEWDHDALMNEVVRHAFEAGEALTPQDLGDAIQKVAGIGYWRVTALKERGIDVDQYRRSEPGKFTVQVHGEGSDV